MSKEAQPFLGEVFKEITEPLDWIMGATGALAGIGLRIFIGGTDLGTSIAAGFMGGVLLRKSWIAFCVRKRLLSRAKSFEDQLKRHLLEIPKGQRLVTIGNLLKELREEKQLWEIGITNHRQFEESLDSMVEEYRRSAEMLGENEINDMMLDEWQKDQPHNSVGRADG